MANIVLGSIVSDIRGSVGAETYSRTLAGLIVKARSNPSQPESEFRDAAQAIFTEVTQAWSGRISESQRQAWNAYAARYPRPNRWGNPIVTSGFLAFVRANCTVKQRTPAQWFDIPPKLGMLPAPIFTFRYLDYDPMFMIVLTLDPAYTLKAADCLIISIGKAVNVGVTYYSTPWRFLESSEFDGEAWDPGIDWIDAGEFPGEGDRVFVKATIYDNLSGRMSVPFQNHANLEPP